MNISQIIKRSVAVVLLLSISITCTACNKKIRGLTIDNFVTAAKRDLKWDEDHYIHFEDKTVDYYDPDDLDDVVGYDYDEAYRYWFSITGSDVVFYKFSTPEKADDFFQAYYLFNEFDENDDYNGYYLEDDSGYYCPIGSPSGKFHAIYYCDDCVLIANVRGGISGEQLNTFLIHLHLPH